MSRSFCCCTLQACAVVRANGISLLFEAVVRLLAPLDGVEVLIDDGQRDAMKPAGPTPTMRTGVELPLQKEWISLLSCAMSCLRKVPFLFSKGGL